MILNLGVALLAGLVSFLSPCILPLIPGYLAYLGGVAPGEAKTRRKDTFMASVFFVLGFAAIFSAVGVLLNTALERVAYDVQIWLGRAGGTLMVLFGLYLVGVLKIPILEREHKLAIKIQFKSRQLTSFIFGAAFAAGWTPCVGAVLGGILGLAASAPGSAFGLLLAYSLGLGVPFLLVGFFGTELTRALTRHGRTLQIVRVIFGIVLVMLGVLAFTQNLGRIASLGIIQNIIVK